MHNFLRVLLILGIAGSAMTVLASGAAWWFEEERRLRRLVWRCLGGEPDGVIVARGRNAAARSPATRLSPARAGQTPAPFSPRG
jgi:hypothetical protein